MRIFKFGGTSISDASHIKQVTNILKSEGFENLIVVVSAMGKMTNAIESLIHPDNTDTEIQKRMREIRDFHNSIINELEINTPDLLGGLENIYESIHETVINNSLPYNSLYDKCVSSGELISSQILHAYFNKEGIPLEWIDARELIYTDGFHRQARVEWQETCHRIRATLKPGRSYLTQGFIAGSADGTVTLGREGSDFSAAVFAHCTNAASLTIWKDVPGVLNADPRYFNDTRLLDKISYNEALEMSFYGASIIHPKTIKPLQNKNIPLYVRSFEHPSKAGSHIAEGIQDVGIPRFILKKNQILLSISTRDFSFIVEKHISRIFQLFDEYKITVNLMQNSAMSFSVCLEDTFGYFDTLAETLHEEFYIRYNKQVSLLTIRHINDEEWAKVYDAYRVLLSQKTGKTAQFIVE